MVERPVDSLEQARDFMSKLLNAPRITHEVLIQALEDNQDLIDYCKVDGNYHFINALESDETDALQKAELKFLLVCGRVMKCLEKRRIYWFDILAVNYSPLFDGSINNLEEQPSRNLLCALHNLLIDDKRSYNIHNIFDEMSSRIESAIESAAEAAEECAVRTASLFSHAFLQTGDKRPITRM